MDAMLTPPASRAGIDALAGDGDTEQHGQVDYAPAANPDKTIMICEFPIADLILQLTTAEGQVVDFVVCKTPILLSSPVFAQMLSPTSKMPSLKRAIASDGQMREYLYLFDDDDECLLVFLRAVHLQFDKVPQHVTFEQLVNLATFSDKYDCVKVFDTWRNDWLDSWCGSAKNLNQGPWLKIAVVFGEPRNFTAFTKAIIQCTGPLFSVDGVIRPNTKPDARFREINPHIPENLLVLFKTHRDKTLESLVTISRKYLADLQSKPSGNASQRCNELCMAATYGCLIRSAYNHKSLFWTWGDIYDPSDTPAMELSIDEYYEQIIKCIESAEKELRKLKAVHDSGHSCGMEQLINDFKNECSKTLDDVKGFDPEEFMRYSRSYGKWENL